MYTQKPDSVITGLSAEFKKNNDVLALVLVGSYAREDAYGATDQSDIDMYIIARDESVPTIESSLPHLVSRFGNVLFSFKHQIGFVAVYDTLLRMEIPVIKRSDLKSVFSRPKSQTVKVLFDRTEGALQEVLDTRPESMDFATLFSKGITNFWYWQIISVQYFKKGEFYNARKVVSIQESALIKLYELLNDPTILLLETNKRIEKFLTTKQQDELRQISPAYDKDQINAALHKVVEIIPRVAQEVAQKYGFDYDHALEDSVKQKIVEYMK